MSHELFCFFSFLPVSPRWIHWLLHFSFWKTTGFRSRRAPSAAQTSPKKRSEPARAALAAEEMAKISCFSNRGFPRLMRVCVILGLDFYWVFVCFLLFACLVGCSERILVFGCLFGRFGLVMFCICCKAKDRTQLSKPSLLYKQFKHVVAFMIFMLSPCFQFLYILITVYYIDIFEFISG